MKTCRIWRAPNNASKWQTGFNSVFKGQSTCMVQPPTTGYSKCLMFSVNILNHCTIADKTEWPALVDYTSFRYVAAVQQPWA